jgi:hypothetical protein
MLYGFDNADMRYISQSSNLGQKDILEQWIKLISSHSRTPTSVTKEAGITQEIRRLFSTSIPNVKSKSLRISNPKFFVDKTEKYRLVAFETESQFTDFILFFSIGGYLTLLFFVM